MTDIHTDHVDNASDTADSSSPTPLERSPAAHRLLDEATCTLGSNGNAYLLVQRQGITVALRAGSKPFNHYLRERARELGDAAPKRSELAEIGYLVQSVAESNGRRTDVWLRVGKIPGGIEIDLGDESHRRVRITERGVEEVQHSGTVFERAATMKPLVRPAATGNLDLLNRYLPEKQITRYLLLAYITYVLAHPKTEHTKYVILILSGEQGSGKSFTSKLIQRLIDPSVVTAQVIPSDPKSLAIATKNAHLVVFDNIRSFSPYVADALCIAATGGSITGRQLYTDNEQNVTSLHGATLLNGLHHFVDQPDLAQRSLHIHLPSIQEEKRRSEHDMEAELAAAMPSIMRGLYELTSKLLKALPDAKVTAPHRMLDFVRWLAAMEVVLNVPTLQEFFVFTQAQGQRDALQENILSATVLEFAEKEKKWTGTPTELLKALNERVSEATRRARDWPANPIALSRRLIPMVPALKEQQIRLEMTRGTERRISIYAEETY
jgi:hypothetical protein